MAYIMIICFATIRINVAIYKIVSNEQPQDDPWWKIVTIILVIPIILSTM